MTDFPIMGLHGARLGTIPFAVLEPHRKQAMRNHDQTLERLAERGGLSPDEAIQIIQDENWSGITFVLPDTREKYVAWIEQKWAELQDMVEQWQESQQHSATGG